MLLVSPHLDDAVFSCGALLSAWAGCRVVTIFAGTPSDPDQSTDWDRRCGFTSAGEAMARRRREDAQALDLLGAEPMWLDFCDSQYGETPSVEAVARALSRAIGTCSRQPAGSLSLLVPLGLFHSDHHLAHRAALQAIADPNLREAGPVRLLAYEDSPYRGLKGLVQERLAMLRSAGTLATPIDLAAESAAGGLDVRGEAAAHLEAKRTALAAYASQLRGFGAGGYEDAWRPERFWMLEPACASADG